MPLGCVVGEPSGSLVGTRRTRAARGVRGETAFIAFSSDTKVCKGWADMTAKGPFREQKVVRVRGVLPCSLLTPPISSSGEGREAGPAGSVRAAAV